MTPHGNTTESPGTGLPEPLPTGVVSFLFTDIEGSSALVERLGEGWALVLDEHDARIARAVEDHGGRVVNTEGDAVFAVFADACEAVAAALDAQRALAVEPWPHDTRPRVRMGVHTGPATLGGRDYAGVEVHRAARIAAAGHGGQLLISSATRARVADSLPEDAVIRDLGEHGMRGLTEPERITQVTLTGMPDRYPPLRAVRSRVGALPAQLSSFVGRRAEVHGVIEALRDGRLVTITGPGGTGKTRVALAVAEEMLPTLADRAAFVGLGPVTDPGLFGSSVADALDVRAEPGRAVMDTLVEYLAGRDLLLVLDNMEQLVDAGPDVGRLVGAGPGVRALVTSRAPLHVTGEREVPLGPLPAPIPGPTVGPEDMAGNDAVALFMERAREVDPGFALTRDNAWTVAAICAALDGLPLAIELAASRLRLLTPAAILERLGRCLTLLTGGPRDRPARQQTIRGTIDWSHDLLSPDAQVLMRRLGVFTGGAGLSAIEEVCAHGLRADPLDVIGELVDQSLLRRVDNAREPRFRMLQVIREYALERLADAGEVDEVAARHARWMRELVASTAGRLTGSDQASCLERLDREHDNIRSAIGWTIDRGDAATGLEIAAPLWRYWQLRDQLEEGHDHLTALLRLEGAANAGPLQAEGLDALGSIAYWGGSYAEAEDLYTRALTLHERDGREAAAAEALFNLGWVDAARSRWEPAERRFTEVVARQESLGNRTGAALALTARGMTMHRGGDPEAAVPAFHEALDLLASLDEPWWSANARAALGFALFDLDRFAESQEVLVDALRQYAAIGDDSGIRFTLDFLSRLEAARGAPERAVRLGAAADAMRERLGARAPESIVGTWDVRAAVTDAMDPDTVARLWDEGRAMPAAEMIAYAEGGSGPGRA